MTPHTDTDIAALRALAEDGRQAPLAAGPALVLAGLLVPTACIGGWVLAVAPDVARPLQIAGLLGFCVFGGIGGQMLLRQLAPAIARGTVLARAEGMVWGLGGLATAVFAAMLVLRGLLGLPTPANVMGAIATVAFLQFGVAYFVTAGLSRQRWLQKPGYGAFLAALVCGLVADETLVMPVIAFLMVMVALLPGVVMIRMGRIGA